MSVGDPSVLARDIGAIVGSAQMRAPAALEARVASIIVAPRDAGEIAELVRKCEADAITIAPIGAARTLAQIRPVPVAVGISLERMNRVIAYEPDDMTVVAEAGLTLAELNLTTKTHGQRLPADPSHPEHVTLGALVAAAQAGPIRLSEGTVRDLLIGVRFVGHHGRVVHGGGRVVKNVAGYDLMKVMTGSFGTLGVITETVFKVRPIPERYTLVAAPFPGAAQAFAAATAVHDAAPLVHLELVSAEVAQALGYRAQTHVMAGLAGNAEAVAWLAAQSTAILGAGSVVMAEAEAARAYERLRDVELPDAAIVAQIAVAPGELASCVGQCEAEFRAHAGCGVAQIAMRDAANADEVRGTIARWREIAHRARGHLRVLRVVDEFRDGVEFFDEPPRPALGLMRRLKAAFDPSGIFNPGCFIGGL